MRDARIRRETIEECARTPEAVEQDGSDWSVPPEPQAMRDARIRRDAIEECAKVCDAEKERWKGFTAYGAECCAERIRAL